MQPFHLNQATVNFFDLGQTTRLYAEVMGLWLHYRSFLGNPYVEVRYEDLVADVEGRVRALLAFVGLEWDAEVLRFHEHVRERDVKTPSYSGVASPICAHAVGQWRNYRAQVEPVAAMLRPFVEAFGYEHDEA